MRTIVIKGMGCALMDFLYSGIDFNGEPFRKYLSRKNGDGGISPGRLVFTEELEKFAGIEYTQILKELTGVNRPLSENIGGPAIVALIHSSQMLGDNGQVHFYGARGEDPTGLKLENLINKTGRLRTHFSIFKTTTAFTDVLSDPDYDDGHGERCFINNIGASGDYLTDHVNEDFFDADINVFGGTALVPEIHDKLDYFLERSKKAGAFTIVNTVYDFRNEKRNPGKPWPLVNGKSGFEKIDLLIMDAEEARRISGINEMEKVRDFFKTSGLHSCVITDGPKPIWVYAVNKRYSNNCDSTFPVSHAVLNDLRTKIFSGDTTGCGDNFAGGLIYSIAHQLRNNTKPAIDEAVKWGIVSGGFACFYYGGTYFESKDGEKLDKIKEYYERTFQF